MEDEIRVVRGTPTAEEVAALVGVLFLARGRPAPAVAPTASRWWRSGLPRREARPGPGAWRASALPR